MTPLLLLFLLGLVLSTGTGVFTRYMSYFAQGRSKLDEARLTNNFGHLDVLYGNLTLYKRNFEQALEAFAKEQAIWNVERKKDILEFYSTHMEPTALQVLESIQSVLARNSRSSSFQYPPQPSPSRPSQAPPSPQTPPSQPQRTPIGKVNSPLNLSSGAAVLENMFNNTRGIRKSDSMELDGEMATVPMSPGFISPPSSVPTSPVILESPQRSSQRKKKAKSTSSRRSKKERTPVVFLSVSDQQVAQQVAKKIRVESQPQMQESSQYQNIIRIFSVPMTSFSTPGLQDLLQSMNEATLKHIVGANLQVDPCQYVTQFMNEYLASIYKLQAYFAHFFPGPLAQSLWDNLFQNFKRSRHGMMKQHCRHTTQQLTQK